MKPCSLSVMLVNDTSEANRPTCIISALYKLIQKASFSLHVKWIGFTLASCSTRVLFSKVKTANQTRYIYNFRQLNQSTSPSAYINTNDSNYLTSLSKHSKFPFPSFVYLFPPVQTKWQAKLKLMLPENELKLQISMPNLNRTTK